MRKLSGVLGHSQHSGTSVGMNQIEMTEKIEKLCKTIDAKLQLLKFTSSLTDSAIENGNFTAVERLRNTLAKKVEEVVREIKKNLPVDDLISEGRQYSKQKK